MTIKILLVEDSETQLKFLKEGLEENGLELLLGFPDGSNGKESACSTKESLEKEMATYSIILVWKIPWIEESGRL